MVVKIGTIGRRVNGAVQLLDESVRRSRFDERTIAVGSGPCLLKDAFRYAREYGGAACDRLDQRSTYYLETVTHLFASSVCVRACRVDAPRLPADSITGSSAFANSSPEYERVHCPGNKKSEKKGTKRKRRKKTRAKRKKKQKKAKRIEKKAQE